MFPRKNDNGGDDGRYALDGQHHQKECMILQNHLEFPANMFIKQQRNGTGKDQQRAAQEQLVFTQQKRKYDTDVLAENLQDIIFQI